MKEETKKHNGDEPKPEDPQVPAPIEQAHSLQPLAGHLTEDMLEQMEKQIELRERMLAIVQKTVRPRHWRIFGERAYLEGAGGYQVGAVLGIKYEFSNGRKVRKDNGHYMWIFDVTAELGGRRITSIGVCASDNQFFKRKVRGPDGKEVTVAQPPEEVDEANVMKKAQENGVSRVSTALLGLRGLTANDLEKMGFDMDEIGGRVKYRKGSKGGDKRSQAQRNQDVDDENKALDEARNTFARIRQDYEADLVQMGLDGDDFWRRVTHWENPKDGSTREFTMAEAGKFVEDGIRKYGKCQALWAWEKKAKEVAEAMQKEVENA